MHKRSSKASLRQADRRGFTLIELVITVAIVAILASVAMPLHELVVQRAKQPVFVQPPPLALPERAEPSIALGSGPDMRGAELCECGVQGQRLHRAHGSEIHRRAVVRTREPLAIPRTP